MKRAQEEEQRSKASKIEDGATPSDRPVEQNDDDMGEFEDPYGDEFESEESDEEIFEAGEDGEPPKDDEVAPAPRQRVYLPGNAPPLGANEVMEPDLSVYHMLHSMNVAWPCLSFDIIGDTLGSDRRSYPHSMYMVTGTQAKRAKDNEVLVMKLGGLGKTLVRDEEDEEEDDSDDEDYDSDPVLESRPLPTNATTNRVRASPFGATTGEYLAATMAEDGLVHIWDVSSHLSSLDRAGEPVNASANRPVHTIKAHGKAEGWGIDWSPLVQSGSLLTGDVDGRIYLTTRTPTGWSTDSQPFTCDGSVEDIQWSHVERTVFASGGGDGNVNIWDTRQASHRPALSVRAAAQGVDVNVLSWNRRAAHMLASGHDDGRWSVWDLRNFTSANPEPVASFGYHKSPITSLEFCPTDESVVAVGSEDSTVTLWDLAVEADDEEVAAQRASADGGELDGVPPQLLFVHWQPQVKEVHWHRQIPGTLVSTGSQGFSVFKTISV